MNGETVVGLGTDLPHCSRQSRLSGVGAPSLTLSGLATVAAGARVKSEGGSRMSPGILATASSTSTMRGLSPPPSSSNPSSQESSLDLVFYMHCCEL